MSETNQPSVSSVLKQLHLDFKVLGEHAPLAIGIDKQIQTARPDIDRKTLRAALGAHTRSTRYLKALQHANQRFDLQGQPVGEVTDEQRALASKELTERFRKRAEAEKAARIEKSKKEKAEQAERERAVKLEQLVSKFGRK